MNVLEQHRSNSLDMMGDIKPSLAFCVFGVFVLVYFSLWKGVRSSGKVVWVTALAPYVVLLILLARGVTLPGAAEGIRYYLTPEWHKLKNSKVVYKRNNQKGAFLFISMDILKGLDRRRIADLLFTWTWIRNVIGIIQLQ